MVKYDKKAARGGMNMKKKKTKATC